MNVQFKAKSLDTNKWIVGGYYEQMGQAVILHVAKGNLMQQSAVDPDTVCMVSPVLSSDGTPICENDFVLDTLSKQKSIVKYGLCKKHAFFGWFLETDDARQFALLNDENSDKNKYLEIQE